MKLTKSLTIASALLCGAFLATDASAQKRDRDRWVELGCQQVSFLGKDRDVLHVGRKDGRFEAIRLRVKGNAVEMLDLKVVYANGEPDDIPVRSQIRAGSETRPLDLKGRERAIDRVEMVYRSQPSFKGLATVCVDGRT